MNRVTLRHCQGKYKSVKYGGDGGKINKKRPTYNDDDTDGNDRFVVVSGIWFISLCIFVFLPGCW